MFPFTHSRERILLKRLTKSFLEKFKRGKVKHIEVTVTHSLPNHIFCHERMLPRGNHPKVSRSESVKTPVQMNSTILSHQSLLQQNSTKWYSSKLTSQRPSSPEARTRANVDSCAINDKMEGDNLRLTLVLGRCSPTNFCGPHPHP